MKSLFLIFATCSIGLCAGQSFASPTDSTSQENLKIEKTAIKDVQAGSYLASRFAQKNHDWKNANQFINKLIDADIAPDNIVQRAMVLAMGSGNSENAIKIAKRSRTENPDSKNTIADIFLISEAFKKEDYIKAEQIFKALPNDGTKRFVGPFIEGWLKAAQGSLSIKDLKDSTVQLYHGILISDFLNDHTDIEKTIDLALKVENISIGEIERIAALYGHIGLKEKSLNLYKTILKSHPNNENIKKKISDQEKGLNEPLFEKVTTARHGISKAFHDISTILFSEQNDESARIFAHVALYLEPEMTETKLLLAKISTHHKQYEEAISFYESVPKSEESYIHAQHEIVDIYEETENFNEALKLLKNLSKNHEDVDTLIKIGNLHRHQEQFKLALKAYDKAIKSLGGSVPKEYWHLHYVRGIAYEQADNWGRAEEELKAALAFQPDHPYILNYLGYAWADKGINLDESLKMIQRAVDLRPSDGYITDSLGWVMYRVEDYESAVPILERAVELLPYDPTINDHLGDAYWKVGRQLEAKFQWKRAKNHSEDEKQVKEIEEKLVSGIKHQNIASK